MTTPHPYHHPARVARRAELSAALVAGRKIVEASIRGYGRMTWPGEDNYGLAAGADALAAWLESGENAGLTTLVIVDRSGTSGTADAPDVTGAAE